MRVTFLGTGTSHGVPMIGCDCAVCRSEDSRNKRLRPAVFVEQADTHLLVDAPPDFRTQALRANLRQVDAVLVTHAHADHILGLDDLRAFTEREDRKLPVYGSAATLETIATMFAYACTDKPAWRGLPSFQLQPIEPFVGFAVRDVEILPLPVTHGRMTVLGFLFNREIAYVTDCNEVPDSVVQRLQGVTVLVLDALRYRPHPTHLNFEQALALAARVGAKLTLFTHLCHEVEHAAAESALPAGVRIAYDGLTVETRNGSWSIVAG